MGKDPETSTTTDFFLLKLNFIKCNIPQDSHPRRSPASTTAAKSRPRSPIKENSSVLSKIWMYLFLPMNNRLYLLT